MKFPIPLPYFVNVPLVIEKFPERLIVLVLLACLKISNVPEAKDKSPPIANEQLPDVLEPNGAKYPPVIDKLPAMFDAKVLELVNNKQEVEFTEDDVCDWIDEIGGIFNPEGLVLLYLKYIVQHTVTTVQGNPKEKKKKSNKVRVGFYFS